MIEKMFKINRKNKPEIRYNKNDMKTIGMILLALTLVTVSCKNEKNVVTDKDVNQTQTTTVEQQTEATDTVILADNETLDEVELPIYGNFKLDSKEDVLTLVGFYPENGMEIFDFTFDQENVSYNEKRLFFGDYHVVGQPKDGVYTVVFNLTSDSLKTKETGRIKIEYHEPKDDELHTFWITPLKGYDLGLPHGKASEVPISAYQAWD